MNIAGADIREFGKPPSGTPLHDVNAAIENSSKPIVAAIHGTALGGGLEICLASNHRIAWDDRSVQLGLPEVTLGLLPGAGGVVRMVNLLGLEKSMPYLNPFPHTKVT